jgi:hypothetical protein
LPDRPSPSGLSNVQVGRADTACVLEAGCRADADDCALARTVAEAMVPFLTM